MFTPGSKSIAGFVWTGASSGRRLSSRARHILQSHHDVPQDPLDSGGLAGGDDTAGATALNVAPTWRLVKLYFSD